ncbi:uncharacterized protein LOC143285757 isoform X2 [Babylonia areolata]|uniref:uncharacterized protein LOC143285757 isoform X2 n=1 Tax=Babylonia areolata TaxID=304850 RepID=UPI003FCF708A
MGKFRACAVTLKHGQEVFRDGERVTGVVMLDVAVPVVVKGVRVFCHGEALTKWSKDFTRDWNSDQVTTEKYFAQVCNLFGKKQNQEGPNLTLTVGKHRWAFAFRLPADRLPSSFEGQYGAIRWFLKVEVDKPFPSINNKWYKPFTVLSNLNINEPVYQPAKKKEVNKTVSKALGLGNAGTLTLSAQTNHFGYCPGEAIVLTVEAKNDSTKDMGKIMAALVQSVVFSANDETKSTSIAVSSLQSELSLAKGTTMTLTDILLPVPAVPPSTRKLTCHNILCTYTVKVCVHVPWGLDLEAVIPIAIGTVPRGCSRPSPNPTQPQAAAAAAAAASGGGPPIQYVKCETGITPCTKSHNNFPNLPFTPHTAYVLRGPGPQLLAASPTPTPTPTSTKPQAQPSASAVPQTKDATDGATQSASISSPTMVRGPPSYTQASALPSEADLPPAYEDVMRMEEKERAMQTAAAMTVPEGRECVFVLARFPDSALSSFRETIRRDQNNLLDNDLAFLAALSPQPLTGLDGQHDVWPEHRALAMLVFPDRDSGEEWLRGVADSGDPWYPDSDVILLPASWSLPPGISDRLTFGISLLRTKEGVTRDRLLDFQQNTLSHLLRLRLEHGGIRQSVSKKPTLYHGSWVGRDHNVSVICWPKVHNYMAYLLEEEKEHAQQMEEFRSMIDIQRLLLVSEDLTSLSTQSAASPGDDVTAGEEGDNNEVEEGEEEEEEEKEGEEESADDNKDEKAAENLLGSRSGGGGGGRGGGNDNDDDGDQTLPVAAATPGST